MKNPTKRDLDKALSLIGWFSSHHGAGYYRIYNHKGRCTAFMFVAKEEDATIYEIRIDEYEVNSANHQRPFGRRNSDCGTLGALVFLMAGCDLELLGSMKTYEPDKITEEEAKSVDCVSIVAKGEAGKELAFLSFYNHDKNPSPPHEG